VVIVRARDLGASPAVVGAVLAGAGAGAIAGALVAPRLQRWLGARVLLLGVMWFWAVLMLVLPAVHSLPALGVFYGALSLPGPAFNVSLSSYRYALVPDELMARVRSVSAVVGWGTIPLGSLAAGILAQGLGASRALLVIAAVMALVTVSCTVPRVIRQAPSIDELLLH
jgi:predicted MFS family arabinose efflux permease